MKALLLNTHDIAGGAARAAYRLHTGLKQQGVRSQMLVQTRTGDDHDITGPVGRWGKGIALLRPFLDKLPLMFHHYSRQTIFYPAWLPDAKSRIIEKIDPDICHLHWISEGFLRVESLSKFHRPMIWTMHDMWPFTGGCHYYLKCNRYEDSCGKCPGLASVRKTDVSHRVWSRKNRAWEALDITLASPSRWLAECARRSSLFKNKRIEVVPNGLDIEIYRPMGKQPARNILGLPMDKKLILFGALSATSDKRKGFHLLQPALQKLAAGRGNGKETEVIIFGSSEPAEPPDFGMKTRFMGRLHDDVSLALLYSAADIFIAPSIQESFCQTASEAMSCATPVVAFNATGLKDVVDHQKNGYLARPYEPEDLAYGISWALGDENRIKRLSAAAREKAVNEFSLELMAQRYLDLYMDIIDSYRQNI